MVESPEMAESSWVNHGEMILGEIEVRNIGPGTSAISAKGSLISRKGRTPGYK